MNMAERLKAQALIYLATARNWWSGLRLADPFRPKQSLGGFRLARTGKNRNSMLTRHEQTRNPAGTKLWKKHCKWEFAQ